MIGLGPYETGIILVVWLAIAFGPVIGKIILAFVRRWTKQSKSKRKP